MSAGRHRPVPCRLAAVALAAVLGAGRAGAVDWQAPWREPADGAAARAASDEYAWRVFVAINWPSDASRRRADARARLGADRPVVWETWPTANDVFRSDAQDPGPWPRRRPGGTPAGRFETVSAKDRPNLRHVAGGVMVPGADPAAAVRLLTEIRINEDAYEYVRARRLYALEGQLAAYQSAAAVEFPAGAKTIKARWRPIAEAERSRYHTLAVRGADGATRLYGLVALHVATKDLPTWFWATFEHEDNPTRSDGEQRLRPSRDGFACAPRRPDCDAAPAGVGLEGTVWSHYRLRGTMTRYVDDAGAPELLANSELEAGMQASASCMTCHARAAIGVAGGAVVRLPIFDAGAGADPGERRGFVGLPRAEWFEGGAGGAPGGTRFQPLDFVWSLARAHAAAP
jgi:hypothetical protein